MQYLKRFAVGVLIVAVGFPWVPIPVAHAQRNTQQQIDARRLASDMLERIRESKEIEFTAKIVMTKLVGGNESTTAQFRIRQPNQFYVRVKRGKFEADYVSDGKTLTIYRPSIRQYAQVPARDPMLSTMYLATGLTSLSGRLLNFFWVADLNRDTRFSAIKRQKVNGQDCRGIRIDRFEERFDVWFSETQRLPCKLIGRRTDGGGTDTQTVTFLWKLNPGFSVDEFNFVPPSGSRPFLSE